MMGAITKRSRVSSGYEDAMLKLERRRNAASSHSCFDAKG